MGKIAVVYWSGSGNTKEMAEAVMQGAKEDAQAELFFVTDFRADRMADFDGIAFGCPAMGDEELEESEFEPVFEACESGLDGKRIVLFGSYGWGGGEWMNLWKQRCEAAGALVCGSVICDNAPDGEALSACRELGKKLAK